MGGVVVTGVVTGIVSDGKLPMMIDFVLGMKSVVLRGCGFVDWLPVLILGNQFGEVLFGDGLRSIILDFVLGMSAEIGAALVSELL